MESGNSHSSILAEVFSEKLPAEGKNSRFRCECAYDGTDFCGWQSQKSGGSVQDFIEARLGQILKKPIRIHGSGRTDSGVHATGQVFHFDAVWDHPAYALLAALRSTNRTDVFVKSLKRVGNDFHARYSAKGKRYVYYIHTGVALPHLARYRWSLKGLKPDIDKMNAAAEALVGEQTVEALRRYLRLPEDRRAGRCIRCGKCQEHCPQHIAIPEKLAELSRAFARLEEEHPC